MDKKTEQTDDRQAQSTTRKIVKTAAKIAWVVPAVIASIETSRAENPEGRRPT